MVFPITGYEFSRVEGEPVNISGTPSKVYPTVVIHGEEDDDNNIYQLTLGVDEAREFAALLIEVADAADKREAKEKEAA